MIVTLLLLACSSKVTLPVDSPLTDDSQPGDTGSGPAPARDYRLTGPFEVQATSDTEDVGCDMDYDRYTPVGQAPLGYVVLSHGFSRNNAAMADWGAHFASWGLDVVVPNLCHASFFDADHAQNAVDIAALAAALGFQQLVYAGHSAGGLASFLAAGQDTHALAVLGLDPVDSDDLGLNAAGSVSVPAYGLFGESSQCNSSNNGIAMLDGAPDHRAVRISEADHCDFESPTDWVCTAICQGDNNNYSETQIADGIRGLATSFLLWQAGAAPEAEQWWQAGEPYYEELRASGLVTDL